MVSPLLVIGGKEITLWPPVSFRQGYTDLKKELILKNKLPKNLPRIKEMKIVVKARHLKKKQNICTHWQGSPMIKIAMGTIFSSKQVPRTSFQN